MSSEYSTYTADLDKITAYEAAAKEDLEAVVYGNGEASAKSVTPTGIDAEWTYALTVSPSTEAAATIVAKTGVVTFTEDGTVTVSGTASKAGYAVNVTITKPQLTMANIDSAPAITAE